MNILDISTKRASITIIAIFFITIFSLNSFAQTVPIGSGSYSTSLPSGEVGPQTVSGANAVPKISAAFDQPIQTNDYWSSLIYPFMGDAHSNIIYAHPLNFRARNNGLQIGYTTDHIFAANDFLYPYSNQLTVGVSGLTTSQTTTERIKFLGVCGRIEIEGAALSTIWCK